MSSVVIKAEAPVNIIHDNEMYGQIVAYYRAKGMVPPTTADRPAMGKKKE